MALQTSGVISLNDIHLEAGGTSGTQVSINDADIRDMLDRPSGYQSSFSSFYGAASTVEQVLWTTTLTAASFGDDIGFRTSYEIYMQGYGALSDRYCDFIDDADGNQARCYVMRGNADNDSFVIFFANEGSQVIFNEGFDRVVVRAADLSEVSLNRTDANFSFDTYYLFSYWTWSVAAGAGPLTDGVGTYTVEFVNDVPA